MTVLWILGATVIASGVGIAIGVAIAGRRARAELMAGAGPRLASGEVRTVGDMSRAIRHELDEVTAELGRVTNRLDTIELGLETSERGFVLSDPDGSIVFRNAVARVFAEARHSEALVASTVDELLALAREGESDQRLVELVGPPRRSFHVAAHPVRMDQESLGAVAFITDVTESQRTEAARRDFVANVSHELKTPVGALSLLAETLSVDDEPEVIARMIDRLQGEAHRVAETIDDLMTLSAIEHRDGARFQVLDMAEVVDGALDRLAESAGLRDIELVRPPIDEPTDVVGEQIQLESAVFNLVDNAIKFSDPGGRVEVRLAVGGGLVAVAIQDEGVGIPSAELERIFERFYRVDKARSRQTGGTGLGLSIVRHVVRNHGGEIEVSSREGEGSTFTILLPAHDAEGFGSESPDGEIDLPDVDLTRHA